VGGLAGMFTAGANASNPGKAKDLQASQLAAAYGSLDKLLEEVTRLRINPQGFLEAFYGDPKAFAKAVAQLNEALARERLEVEALGKALDGVAQQQGVLSRQQIGELGRLDPRSPAGEQLAAFVEGQRE